MNRQAQSGSELVSRPRANEPVAFYTVRTKSKEGQVQTKGKQKGMQKGGGLLFGESEQRGVGVGGVMGAHI